MSAGYIEEYRGIADFTLHVHSMLKMCFLDYRRAVARGDAASLRVFIEDVRMIYTLLPMDVRRDIDRLVRRKVVIDGVKPGSLEELLEYRSCMTASGEVLIAPEFEGELEGARDAWMEDQVLAGLWSRSWGRLLDKARVALAVIVEVLGERGLLFRVSRTFYGSEE